MKGCEEQRKKNGKENGVGHVCVRVCELGDEKKKRKMGKKKWEVPTVGN